MVIPTDITIGGIKFEVEKVNLLRARASDAAGLCEFDFPKILISDNQRQDKQESTFIHECLEAINEQYELNLDHYKISILEAALYQVIKQI